jgi:hypothetical protein
MRPQVAAAGWQAQMFASFRSPQSLLSNLQSSDRLVVVASGEGAWDALVEIMLRRLIQ